MAKASVKEQQKKTAASRLVWFLEESGGKVENHHLVLRTSSSCLDCNCSRGCLNTASSGTTNQLGTTVTATTPIRSTTFSWRQANAIPLI